MHLQEKMNISFINVVCSKSLSGVHLNFTILKNIPAYNKYADKQTILHKVFIIFYINELDVVVLTPF